MRAILLLLVLLMSPVALATGQVAEPERSGLEFVAMTRVGYHAGAQLEYTKSGHAAPWVSVRYGTQDNSCLLLYGSGCGSNGWSALAGVRLKTRPWGSIEPYLTLGMGQLWWSDGEDRIGGSAEATGTAHVGAIWLGLGRIRPRVEVGYEGHISPWVNLGIGLIL